MQVFLQFDDFLTACKKNISLHKCKGNVFSTVLYKIHQDCIYIYSLVPTCLLSHFMMYSGLKFLLAPVNEVGSFTRRSWKFLAVSFLPCGMTTIMYPDKGLVQAKGDVFILLTTNSEIDKVQFHCKKLVMHLSLCFGVKIVIFTYLAFLLQYNLQSA